MQSQISKTKLIETLKTMRVIDLDESNQNRYFYQKGRNMAVDYLLMEIAFGELDAEQVSK